MAKWKPFDLTWGRSIYYCTECKEGIEVPTSCGKPMYKFCPMCGARMDTADTPQTERRTDRDGDVWEWRGDAWYCIGQADTPQTDCGWGEPK